MYYGLSPQDLGNFVPSTDSKRGERNDQIVDFVFNDN